MQPPQMRKHLPRTSLYYSSRSSDRKQSLPKTKAFAKNTFINQVVDLPMYLYCNLMKLNEYKLVPDRLQLPMLMARQ